MPEVTHHFTVDVEEHFQVSAFEGVVARDDWPRHQSRVRRNVDILLDLLAEHRARGTFFVLGWVAERHGEMVRAIADAGHEVASHGWDHRRVTELTPDGFRDQLRRSKHLLEDLTGGPVIGFRAPSFSITKERVWALDVLVTEGYRYDSSLFPVRRAGYGYAGAQRDPHVLRRATGSLLEFPPTTLRRLGYNLPAAGGAYFRLFPYQVIRAAFRDCERRGASGTFYLHPWELDPDQPRVGASRWARFRHYTGLRRTRPRLTRLLRDFRFTAIADHLDHPLP